MSGGVKIGATTHRAKNRLQRFRTAKFTRIQFKAGDLEISLLRILIAETADLDRHRFRQLARQIINMHSRAAIDVRRIFVGEEKNFHARALEQALPLAFNALPQREPAPSQFFTFSSRTGISTCAALCRRCCRKEDR